VRPRSDRLGLILLAAVILGCGKSPEAPWKTDPHFVMNHRSGRVFTPQETVPAILNTMRIGADAIDVDLRRTADNVLVCFHDRWVMTRECFGRVDDLPWETLSRADVGWEFDPKFTGTRILTFDEVVRFCARNAVHVHLESKVGKEIAAGVLEVIDRHGAIGLVVDMQGLPGPDREDYHPVNLRLHTMGSGGDDDRWRMRRRVETTRGKPLTINVEDAFCLADVLDRHPERRTPRPFILDPLSPAPKDAVPADQLLTGLRGDDERETINAIIRLVWQRERRALDVLRQHAAGHRSTNVRAVALWALGRLDDVDSFDLLAKTAESTPKDGWIVPCAAMWALSELDTPEAVKVMERVVKRGLTDGTAERLGPNGWYCEHALIVLGRMKTSAALDVLGSALESKPVNRYLTQTAAASLARVGGAEAIGHLVTCLDEERPAHRREIVWALIRLQPDSVAPVVTRLRLAKEPVVRVNCLRVLGWCEEGLDGPSEGLLDCLGSTVPEVRGEAAWVCGRHRLVEAAGRLKTLLADADGNVRLDAAQALARLSARH